MVGVNWKQGGQELSTLSLSLGREHKSTKNGLQTHVGFVVVDHKVVDNEMNQ